MLFNYQRLDRANHIRNVVGDNKVEYTNLETLESKIYNIFKSAGIDPRT